MLKERALLLSVNECLGVKRNFLLIKSLDNDNMLRNSQNGLYELVNIVFIRLKNT